jgi:hypothetical protein
MDTKTRAEKILKFRGSVEGSIDARKLYIEFITSQLDEAVREAENKLRSQILQLALAGREAELLKITYAEGFASAREKAAGIAETARMDVSQQPENKVISIAISYREIIAERIRAMEP